VINALTIDLEDWYHVCGDHACADRSRWDAYENRVRRNTAKVLELLARYNTRATFFVLGYIAEKNAALISTIQAAGHEIATHGYWHRRVFELSAAEFEDDVQQSIEVISAITSQPVIGFRAPEWSVRPETPWMLPVLRKLGILYDSSMVPLSGMGSRSFPHLPRQYPTEHGEIWEFPLSTFRLFRERIPFSGGLPLRITPYFYVVEAIAAMNRRRVPAMVYLHPWEFDPEQPKIDLPLGRRFMHYFNIRVTARKAEGLLRSFSFAPVSEVLGLRA